MCIFASQRLKLIKGLMHHDYFTIYLFISTFIYTPDKIRNATRRSDQLSGRSHVMGQFRLYRCKGMSGTAALHIVCNQASKMCTRKFAKKPSRGQIVKSQKISVVIMLSCWISPSNGNHLSRPNVTTVKKLLNREKKLCLGSVNFQLKIT